MTWTPYWDQNIDPTETWIPTEALPRLNGTPIVNEPDIVLETVQEPPWGW